MNEQKKPHEIDIAVGQNIRRIRTMRGMSQEKLGEATGVTFQQIQKNERGVNRVAASRLVQISRALGCTMADLFSGIENIDESTGHASAASQFSTAAIKVAERFDKLTLDTSKQAVLNLVRTLLQVEEQYYDKIDGLAADLDNAVEVALKHGATEWVKHNYPDHYERMKS